MVRMLLLGLVVVLATLGGSYAAMKLPQGSSHTAESVATEELAVTKIDPISVPVVRDGKIQGYMIGRFAFSAGAGEIRKNKDALTLYVSESIFRSVYEEEGVDFSTLKIVQVESLIGRIIEKANARIGSGLIRQVFVESLNFLPYDAVRCQQTNK